MYYISRISKLKIEIQYDICNEEKARPPETPSLCDHANSCARRAFNKVWLSVI